VTVAEESRTTADDARAARVTNALKGAARQLPWLVLLAVLSVLVFAPVIQLQGRAVSDGLQGYRDLATVPKLGHIFYVTILLATVSVAIALVLGIALAWAMTRIPPRLQRILWIVPLAVIVTPGVAVVMGWIYLFSPRVGYGNAILRMTGLFGGDIGPVNIFTVAGIVLFTGFALTAFVYLFIHSALQDMGPEYEEAAAVCGAGQLRTFFTVTLPLLRPAIVYAGGTVLLLGLGQFAAPLLLGLNNGINILTTQIYLLTQAYPINYGLGAALGAPLLVVGVLIIVATRLLLGNPARFASNRRGAGRAWTARGSVALPATLIILYGAVACLLPLIATTIVAFSPYWKGTIDVSAFTTGNVREILSQPVVRGAIVNSLKATVLALAIAIPLGTAVSLSLLTTSRCSPTVRLLLEIISTLPLGIPAALFGFAILFTYTGAPFRLNGSLWIFVIAYVTLALPYATRFASAALITLGPAAIEASRVAGAGPIRTFVSVILPLIRPALASAAALLVAILFQELGASIMVAAPQLQVLGTILFQLWITGIYPQIAVLALISVAVTLLAMAAAWGVAHIQMSQAGRGLAWLRSK
jgi:iron(III) transport system permease protein